MDTHNQMHIKDKKFFLFCFLLQILGLKIIELCCTDSWSSKNICGLLEFGISHISAYNCHRVSHIIHNFSYCINENGLFFFS